MVSIGIQKKYKDPGIVCDFVHTYLPTYSLRNEFAIGPDCMPAVKEEEAVNCSEKVRIIWIPIHKNICFVLLENYLLLVFSWNLVFSDGDFIHAQCRKYL